MALTCVLVKDCGPVGPAYESLVDVTGDSSYATGGEVLVQADLIAMMPRLANEVPGTLAVADVNKIENFLSERDAAGRQWALDRANLKVLAFAAGAEVAGATNLSAVTIRVRVRYGQVN